MFRTVIRVIDDALGWIAMVGCIYFLAIGAILACVLVPALIIASIATWTLPWNWNGPHYPYPRQVTNITYVQDGGINTAARLPAPAISRVSPTTWAMPTCPSGGRDLFNPSGSTSSQVQGGWSIQFLVGNARQTIDLPDSKVHLVKYPGSVPRVQFVYSKIVFYYDQLYNSLWTNTPASGPKSTIIGCMASNSLAQRMQVGLRYATLFEPASGLK